MRRSSRRRGHLTDDDRFPPLDDVADFEEYTWLYHEAWRPEVERWILSVVPSAMIFDDHDMIDDWNTSKSWLEEIQRHPWWEEHVTGGLMSYWVYQHLGNLSPDEIRAEGMLERFVKAGDATEALTAWAKDANTRMPGTGGYRFSFWRELGTVRLVVIDCRQSRVLDPGARRMIDEEDWAWVVAHADVDCEHLMLATSVPVVMPGGHARPRTVGRARAPTGRGAGRSPASPSSCARPSISRTGRRSTRRSSRSWTCSRPSATKRGDGRARAAGHRARALGRRPLQLPSAGDVPRRDRRAGAEQSRPPARQLADPQRAEHPRTRRVLRLGMSPIGALVGRVLRRASGARRHPARWTIKDGPFFANHVCLVEFNGREARMALERAESDEEGRPRLTVAAESLL